MCQMGLAPAHTTSMSYGLGSQNTVLLIALDKKRTAFLPQSRSSEDLAHAVLQSTH